MAVIAVWKCDRDGAMFENKKEAIENNVQKDVVLREEPKKREKIEKVKELLVYGELTLNEISYQMGYSSVQHLSNQFKKVTGLTPSHFKKLKENKRKPLDEV